jgi:hypothetical protein
VPVIKQQNRTRQVGVLNRQQALEHCSCSSCP